MQKYQNSIQDLKGNAVAGASIAVYIFGTASLATIYSDNGVTVIPPGELLSDAEGEFAFYAANGRYNVQVVATGLASQTTYDVLLFDPEDDKQLYSVTDFGAACDGVTDDLAAFNAAIAAIPSGGTATIFVPATSVLSAAITRLNRNPIFNFAPGATIVGGIASKISWPARWNDQSATGPYRQYSSVAVDASYGSARHAYWNITGNAVTNTTQGYGFRIDYGSYAYGAGFDIAQGIIGVWNRSSGNDGGQSLTNWLVSISPTVGGGSTRWGQFVAEYNVVNRYADTGWSAKRSTLNNWSGILQIVVEANLFLQGGTAYNALYGIVFGPSSGNKADGIPGQSWNAILGEPNAVCGDGYFIYASGNDTGTAARNPDSFASIAQTWKRGFSTKAATLTTNRAVELAAGHTVTWVDASGNELNSVYSGTGTPESVVAAPVGSMFLRRDGGASTTLYVKQSGTGNTGWVGK